MFPLSKCQRSSHKSPITRHDKCDLELLVRAVQETTKTLQNIVISFGCPLDMKGEFLSQKTPCTSGSGPRAASCPLHPDLELA